MNSYSQSHSFDAIDQNYLRVGQANKCGDKRLYGCLISHPTARKYLDISVNNWHVSARALHFHPGSSILRADTHLSERIRSFNNLVNGARVSISSTRRIFAIHVLNWLLSTTHNDILFFPLEYKFQSISIDIARRCQRI